MHTVTVCLVWIVDNHAIITLVGDPIIIRVRVAVVTFFSYYICIRK